MNIKKMMYVKLIPIAILIGILSFVLFGCTNINGISKDIWPSGLPKHTEGLDYYNLDELKDVANWLSAHCEDEGFKDSIVYSTFQSFMNQGQVWYSNSNGEITCGVDEIAKKADSSKCNQAYKLNFSGVNRDIDNFLFLKIIGICEDEKTDGGKAGLTFETVSALPVGSEYGEMNSWWGNSTVRQNLQEGGNLYNQLATANHVFTSKIEKVNKYSQQTRRPAAESMPEKIRTSDTFFLPSVSEIFPSQYRCGDSNIKYITDGGEGNQYSYFQTAKFNYVTTYSSDKGTCVASNGTNSGNSATNIPDKSHALWMRSVYSDGDSTTKNDDDSFIGASVYSFYAGRLNNKYLCGVNKHGLLSSKTLDPTNKTTCLVAPMFCF